MRKWILAATTLALAAGTPLAAQANLGLAVTLGVPTGALSNTNYNDGTSEGYNTALGAQFTASFPLDRSLAIRLNLSGMNFSGTAYGPTSYSPGGTSLDSEYSLFSVGGEAQIFLGDGNAMRHTGTYLIGGLELDLDRFDYSANDASFAYSSVNVSRLGLDVGIGHSFRYYGRWRWTLEATYHKTLTDDNNLNSITYGNKPAADFVKLAWGMIF